MFNKREITQEEINHLPLFRYHGEVQIIHEDSQVSKAVEVILQEKILGFDTETRPAFRKGESYPPALLQLAGSQIVYLFQLHKLDNLEPIMDILAFPKIKKVGVAIADDIRKLKELHPFEPKGCIEITELSQDLDIKPNGLRSLAGLLLKYRVSKGAQTSNWANAHLSKAQIAYAATDAWVSRELYLKIKAIARA